VVIVLLILLVSLVQFVGESLARRLTR